jgi:hypothetical protein
MTPVQVVRAVGGDDGDPLPVQHPAQERHQITSGPVGPVQVLQDEQNGPCGGQLGEQAEDRPEQLLLREPGQVAAIAGAGGPVREQAAENRPAGQRIEQRDGRGRTGGPVPQGIGEGQIGNAVAELGAAAGKHHKTAARGPGGQLRDQPGLAHPRVSADQRVGRPAGCGVVEQAEQAPEFTVPADQPFPGRI